MIIYDQTALAGSGILFHACGSALYDFRAVIPALFSACLTAIIANVPEVLEWFQPRVVNGNVVFSSIQFLVSLMVVNRVREAGSRFNATQQVYLQFCSTLVGLAALVTSAIDTSKKELTPEGIQFRTRFLRWIRAFHVLAVEEFQGYESPKYRMGTLLFTEEILLFDEIRKPTRVFTWISEGLMKERSMFGIDGAVDSTIWRLVDQSYAHYTNTRRMASQIYPFPLAQSALMCCILFSMLSPFAFGTMLPNSVFLAPCVNFASVWLTFSFNLAAEMLEWPFDGGSNNLPMKFYTIRFIHDISTIEFSSVAPIITKNVETLMPEFDENVDFVVPEMRPSQTKKDIRDWLERAQFDTLKSSGKRQELRHRLKPMTKATRMAAEQEDILAEGITELRAKGVFKEIR